MRIAILSDTHNEIERTQSAVCLLQAAGADVLVHCGDLTGPEIVRICAVMPSYFTFGNHDADNIPELEKAINEANAVSLGWGDVISIDGSNVAVTHGHMHTDVRRLLAKRPDYLLSGHSHIVRDWHEGPTKRINPGALHEADEFTVAMLDLTCGEVQFLQLP